MKRFIIILMLVLITTLYLYVYPGELKKLSFEQVYMSKGEVLLKPLPILPGWADDMNYYEVKDQKLLKVEARSGKEYLVLDGAKYEKLNAEGFSLLRSADKTADYRRFLFIKDGDIFLFSVKENALTRLTNTKEPEENPTFSPDGNSVAYTMAGNLYVYDIAAKKEKQMTRDGSGEILNGYASWVYYEEILGRAGNYRAFWWSPDSRKLVFMRFDQSKVPVFPIYRADGTYGELEKQRYPKPGYPNPEVKIGTADVATGGVEWIPLEDKDEHYLAFPRWNKKSSAVYFQWLNRGQDHLKVLCWDPAAKKITTVYEEQQKTWVDFLEEGSLQLLKNGDLLVRSSKSGWFHIYYVSRDMNIRPITSGEWTVSNISLVDEKRQQVYFTARKEASTDTDFYCTDFPGKQVTRLTDQAGAHRVTVSPGGSYFIDEYSSVQFPTRMDLRTGKGKLVRRLGDSYTPVMATYDLAKKELSRIKTPDGFELPAAWLLPPGFDKTKKYPVVVSIYGGPGASTVLNYFNYRGSFRDHFLAQQGIIVFSVDHRGSGHFGKKGMALMHRCLGKWEMQDYIEAVKYLRNLPYVDSQRIGITGSSYGGYTTTLALTNASDYFQCGIAGASVIDWALYDSVYTERFMDTPQENPEGYKNASVLSYIDKYKNNSLLITHGTMDDNVHMQNTTQFIDKAEDAGKMFELMLFPNERHGARAKRVIEAKMELDFWLRKFFGKTI
ncbi:MAG: family peptidase [Acidobacteriota bacterium]|nr:family peptidase [Acidobacteriota bacterium]